MKPFSTLLCSATAISCAAGVPAGPAGPAAARPAGSASPGAAAGDPVAAAPGAASPEEAVRAYFRASDTGSSRFLRQAFHPAAQLLWVDDAGSLQILTQLAWWQRFDPATSVPASERRLTILDREGPLALVEAVSRWPTHVFDDLLLVVQTPDGWRIVGKAFEKLAPGATATAAPGDDAAIRDVIAVKIEAHAAYDPALLHRSHTPFCLYATIGVDAVPFSLETLSEGAATYAAQHDAGETDRVSTWRILAIEVRGRIAAVKLDVLFKGRRYIDHLLLVHLAEGWRIGAAAWGDPTFSPGR